MTDYEKLGAFYLGKRKDNEQILLYDSKDLVTHAVCVGMTGSGKTGLCISLLEEAAIDRIPALIIDPKGDLGNLLLTFPELRPGDFEPWVNPDDARLKGLDIAEYAAQQAALWEKGLAGWGQDKARIARLRDAADFAIYTPGSDAGMPVSILKSFSAPDEAAMADRELVRDRISATATSLLGLLGIDADPIQSREHVLISTILDTAWREGRDLDLAQLISQIQTPPFSKIGVMDLDNFYPAKDRFGLAMQLNNLLASPGFEAWLEGEPLDINAMLYTAEGKPRMSIFSIAHLSDAERMYFVSLLLNQTLSWMRAQTGTTSLRAILYMDEIFGYFPPVANPPSKKPLLTLLKQARAFGLGVVLATQNPVDLDYKGLANTGTWFIGRLQTERDKQRVIEGLEGATTASGGRFDRQKMEEILAGLGNRIFLMNNVHEDEPVLFQTRWCLSYLRGPLARPQIKALMQDRKTAAPPPVEAAPKKKSQPTTIAAGEGGAPARPVLPPEIPQYYIPLSAAASEVVYEARLLGAAQIHYEEKKLGVDQVEELLYAVGIGEGAVAVDWQEAEKLDLTLADLETAPVDDAAFAPLPAPAGKVRNYATWNKSFATWLYQSQRLDLLHSPLTGLVSRPGESERDFRIRVIQSAREQRDAITAKLRQKYAPKLTVLEDRMRRAEQAVQREEQQQQSQTLDSIISIGGGLLGAFLGGKKGGVSASKIGGAVRGAGRIRKEATDVASARENLTAVKQQIEELNQQFEEELAAMQAAGDPATETFATLQIKPKKTNITVQLVALGWQA